MNQQCQLYYFDRYNTQEYRHVYLLIHGNRSSSVFWDKLIEQMFAQNPFIRVIAVDLRGFGKSQQITHVETIEEFANDIHHFITEHLKEVPDLVSKLILVGWSLGGMITMNIAANWPDKYKKIFLVSSGMISGYRSMKEIDGKPTDEVCKTKEEVFAISRVSSSQKAAEEKNIDFFRQIAQNFWFELKPSDEEIDRYLAETMLQKNYSEVAWALHNFDLRERAYQISGPVFIYHGMKDKIVNIKYATEIYDTIGHEKCKYVINENVGHMPPIEIPEELAKSILSFGEN